MWNTPDIGTTLTLDFLNPKIKVGSTEEIASAVEKAVTTQMKKTLLNKLVQKIDENITTSILIFCNGTITLSSHVKENMISVEARFFNQNGVSKDESVKEGSDYETLLCDIFGWENNTGNSLYPRGNSHYHLLNKYYHSETMYRNFKLLHREQTKFQDLRIYDTEEMGRCLSLDYMIQNSDTITDDSYTIDLCSLVIKKEEKYNNILLVGAGDMIIPDYILRNFNVAKITLVEIDDRVIENTKKYFKFYERIEEFIKQGRLEVVVDDGAAWLKSKAVEGLQFDGIIIDNSDVNLFEGPADNLFTKEFYTNIHKSLRIGAFFSQQVSDEQVKARWTEMVKSVGFKVIDFKYSITPEYSTALPLGCAMRD